MACEPAWNNTNGSTSKQESPDSSTASHTHKLTEAQRGRLDQFSVAESVDLHCHCLPGIDDGPKTMDESLEMCKAMAVDGITIAVATPHQLGRYEGRNDGALVRQKVNELNEKLQEHNIPLSVLPGGDVRIDERIISLINEGRINTLADAGKYLLLELPTQVRIEPMAFVQTLRQAGIEPILTHPERYPYMHKDPDHIHQWVRGGLLLQITAGSLLGDFGSTTQRLSWRWLEEGIVSVIATDAHDNNCRPPLMSDAISAIIRHLGVEVASKLCLENPLAVLRGWPIHPTGNQLSMEQE